MAGKVIITCALTGSGHTPSMSPYLPYRVSDLVDQGVAAAEAGAAVLHVHARNPEDGSPSADPALFAQYAKGIKERSDAIVSITTGGGTGMTVAERLKGVLELKPAFVGFDAPPRFLVGYGLDHAEEFRHLPYIASLT